MTDKEELELVFKGGDILEEQLKKDGYTTGCVGTCSEVDVDKLERWMDFEYPEQKKKRPTQKYLNSITPEGYRFRIMDKELDYNDSFAIGVSLR